jgi:hypothetical protein
MCHLVTDIWPSGCGLLINDKRAPTRTLQAANEVPQASGHPRINQVGVVAAGAKAAAPEGLAKEGARQNSGQRRCRLWEELLLLMVKHNALLEGLWRTHCPSSSATY